MQRSHEWDRWMDGETTHKSNASAHGYHHKQIFRNHDKAYEKAIRDETAHRSQFGTFSVQQGKHKKCKNKIFCHLFKKFNHSTVAHWS